MLRISKMTDYAIIVLGQMARNYGRTYASAELAEAAGVAPPTVSKILKSLTRAEVLKSTRGARGGYELARPPEKTSIAHIIHALEGPIAITECGLEHDSCDQSTFCKLKTNWHVINHAINNALEAVTLADMVEPMRTVPKEFRISLTRVSMQSSNKVE